VQEAATQELRVMEASANGSAGGALEKRIGAGEVAMAQD
jgi:hypothetical protein